MSGPGWTVLPTVVFRHAGYPFADLASLCEPELAELAAAALDSWRQAGTRATTLVRALRGQSGGWAGPLASAAGMLAPLPSAPGEGADGRVRAALDGYRAAIAEVNDRIAEVAAGHRDALGRGRDSLRALFADPWRQQILLLSNDAVHASVVDWLADAGTASTSRTRKVTDLLTMYLQRVTTKNDTNAHFGPFSVGRFDPTVAGVSWRPRTMPRRRAFLAHWAATALVRALNGDSVDRLAPRPAPLLFRAGDRARLFDFAAGDGLPYPWLLRLAGDVRLDANRCRVLDLVDGHRTVADIAAVHPDGRAILAELAGIGLIELAPELPAGEADTVRTLGAELARLDLADAGADALPDRFAEFGRADPDRRVVLLGDLKRWFTESTGQLPNRRGGAHYADRAILFEDALGPVDDLLVGHRIREFITGDLAVVYDALLIGPRLRINAEHDVLRDWLADRFGPDATVPLGEVYHAFTRDRAALGRACDRIDQRVVAAGDELATLLLAGWDGVSAEVTVDAADVRALVGRYPGRPVAVANPDVMIGAAGPDRLAEGDFYGVVGDCHIVRDLISHGCFAPFLAAASPEHAEQVTAAYRGTLAPGETLLEIVRGHGSKTTAQLDLPVPHLEVSGRSPKPRDQVLQPDDLHVCRDGDRLRLRAPGRLSGDVRLTAAISGSPTIRHDPTAVFAYPRSLGGGVFDAVTLPHLPRIRCGRVVLCRRRWRLPAAALRQRDFRRGDLPGDLRWFLTATALRAEYGFPRRVFAKFSQEPKPIYVDWTAPLLVRQFSRFAHAMSATDEVEISEMLPGPEDLWLELDGHRHTSELRCAVTTGAPG